MLPHGARASPNPPHSPASRTLQRLGGGGQIVVKIGIFDHKIAGDNGQRKVEFDVRLSGRQNHLLRFVPHLRLVAQLHNGLSIGRAISRRGRRRKERRGGGRGHGTEVKGARVYVCVRLCV